MIYRSNLTAPDVAQHFKHLHVRPMGHSFSHDVPSDWADKADDDPVFGIYKRCGMLTHDEGAIVAACVQRYPGTWLDLGAHTGWSSWFMRLGTSAVYPIDPMFSIPEFKHRWARNHDVDKNWIDRNGAALTSTEYFHEKRGSGKFIDGILIDGDHSEGKPLEDAQNAARHLADTGVIMLHDGVGRPVREAVEWLMAHGFNARAYFTPHLVFCCWRGDFTPPDHVPDPIVKAAHLDGRYPDFNFERMI